MVDENRAVYLEFDTDFFFSPLDRASELISSVDPSQICRVKGKGEILLDLETRKIAIVTNSLAQG